LLTIFSSLVGLPDFSGRIRPERLDLYLQVASLLPASVVFQLLRTAAKRGFRETAGFATILSKLLIVQTWRRAGCSAR